MVVAVLGMAMTAAAPAKEKKAPVDEVQVDGTHLDQTSRCNANGVIRVLANESHLLIAGDCKTVVVVGARNWIQVEHADVVQMLGDLNNVFYQDSRTRVDDRGKGNAVTPKWAQ